MRGLREGDEDSTSLSRLFSQLTTAGIYKLNSTAMNQNSHQDRGSIPIRKGLGRGSSKKLDALFAPALYVSPLCCTLRQRLSMDLCGSAVRMTSWHSGGTFGGQTPPFLSIAVMIAARSLELPTLRSVDDASLPAVAH